jgi:hypothetical protein
MTNKSLEQEAQRTGEDNLTVNVVPPTNGRVNGVEPFFTEITEEILEDQKDTMVPISELRKVRYEAAKYRKELQSLRTIIEEEKKNIELAQLEETENLRAIAAKAEAELGSLRGQANRSAKGSAIVNAASIQGFCNPKDAVSLIEFSQIDIDENGNVDEEKAFELVKNLGESKPYLKKDRSKTYYGPTNPAPQQGNWPKPKSANSTQIEQLKNQARDLTRQGRTMEATKLFNRAWEAEHEIKR